MAIVEFKEVSRVYRNGDHEQRALDRVNLQLEEGKFIVILGPSGAGKSTLLNLLGGLDNPTEGTITVKGRASADGCFHLTVFFVWESFPLSSAKA